jgi:transposase-like protein
MSAEPKKEQGRWTSKRKREAVLRLLRGEDLDVVSREMKVTAATLSKWRDAFLDAGQAGLKTRGTDPRENHIRKLERKVGQLAMENELLNEKIDLMEAEDVRPFVRKRPWLK